MSYDTVDEGLKKLREKGIDLRVEKNRIVPRAEVEYAFYEGDRQVSHWMEWYRALAWLDGAIIAADLLKHGTTKYVAPAHLHPEWLDLRKKLCEANVGWCWVWDIIYNQWQPVEFRGYYGTVGKQSEEAAWIKSVDREDRKPVWALMAWIRFQREPPDGPLDLPE
jgi:hypothetical protein